MIAACSGGKTKLAPKGAKLVPATGWRGAPKARHPHAHNPSQRTSHASPPPLHPHPHPSPHSHTARPPRPRVRQRDKVDGWDAVEYEVAGRLEAQSVLKRAQYNLSARLLLFSLPWEPAVHLAETRACLPVSGTHRRCMEINEKRKHRRRGRMMST